jgi:transcriptional regulator with PAS, ATPase and Fis domain
MSDIVSAFGIKKNKKDKVVANSSSHDLISSSIPSSKSMNSNRIGPRVYKVVILGEGGVGKSGIKIHEKSKFICNSILS